LQPLNKPFASIPYFHATREEDLSMIPRLQQALLEDRFHLSDEYKVPERITSYLRELLGDENNLSFVIEGSDKPVGFLVFYNIYPDWKAELSLIVWDWTNWGSQRLRAAQDLIKEVMMRLNLRRLGFLSADPRIRKLATKCLNFEEEGVQRDAFRQGNTLYDVTFFARYA